MVVLATVTTSSEVLAGRTDDANRRCPRSTGPSAEPRHQLGSSAELGAFPARVLVADADTRDGSHRCHHHDRSRGTFRDRLRQALHRRRVGAADRHRTIDVDQRRRPKRSWAAVPDGTAADVDRAVAAAKAAFETWGFTSKRGAGQVPPGHRRGPRRPQRGDRRRSSPARSGMPIMLAQHDPGRPADRQHGRLRRRSLDDFPFEEQIGNSLVVREPIGVVGCDHAVELPAAPDRRPRSRRRSPPAAPSCSSRARSRRSTRSSSPRSSTSRPAAGVFNLVTGTGPVVGEAHRRAPRRRHGVASPARPAPASASPSSPPQTVKRVAPRARRQVGQHRPRRRRPRRRPCRRACFGCYLNSGQTCIGAARACSCPAPSMTRSSRWPRRRPSRCTVGDPADSERTASAR